MAKAVGALYCDDDHPYGDFDLADAPNAEADFAIFAAERELARKAVAGAGLDETFHSRRGNDISLRWIYTHMIEEYARHNGHADLVARGDRRSHRRLKATEHVSCRRR